jgi:hypothetical protein
MNETTYNLLKHKLEADLASCSYIYSVYDVATDRLYQLNNYESDQYITKYFNIVLDQNKEKSPVDYPSTYYCTTITELEQIILYTLEHQDLYTNDDYLTEDPYFDFDTVE